jgi:hypothetical protein
MFPLLHVSLLNTEANTIKKVITCTCMESYTPFIIGIVICEASPYILIALSVSLSKYYTLEQ